MNRHTHINDNDDCYQNQAKEVTDLQQVGLTNTSAFTSFSHVQWWVIYFLRKMVKWTRGTYFSAPDELHPCHAFRWMHPWQMLPEQAMKNQNYPAIIWYPRRHVGWIMFQGTNLFLNSRSSGTSSAFLEDSAATAATAWTPKKCGNDTRIADSLDSYTPWWK